MKVQAGKAKRGIMVLIFFVGLLFAMVLWQVRNAGRVNSSKSPARLQTVIPAAANMQDAVNVALAGNTILTQLLIPSFEIKVPERFLPNGTPVFSRESDHHTGIANTAVGLTLLDDLQ